MPRQRLSLLFAPLVILLVLGSTLTGSERIAFRDVSHFYLPLYDYVAERCSEAWLPLWNPLDQTGIPLIGESSTAVLYPIRYVLFSLPLANETAMNWYLAVHLILAAFFAGWLARRVGMSSTAATIVALTYSLSGGVYSLTCNPPFLVGAAWLPFALGLAITVKEPRETTQPMSVRRRTALFACSLTMMVLGGDPQAALHVCLISGTVLALDWIWQRRAKKRSPRIKQTAVVIVGGALLAGSMSAVQIAASMDWARQSDRVSHSPSTDWLASPVVGSRRANAFEFSIPPWHVAELATPYPFGKLLPANRHVGRLIPGEGRMWSPTMYLGILGFVALAVSCYRIRTPGLDRWGWLCLISLLLCFGHFGLLWGLQQFTDRWDKLDSAIGGPYWWMYHFLPGYDAFRYPAKWLTLFSLACAVTTGRWFDRWQANELDCRGATRWIMVAMGGLLACAGLAVVAVKWSGIYQSWNAPTASDYFWGPSDLSGSLDTIALSIGHSLIVLTLLGCSLWWFRSKSKHGEDSSANTLGYLIALCLALDLGLAARSMLPRINVQDERALAEQASPDVTRPAAHRWIRTQQGEWPQVWTETLSSDRALSVAASERAAWFGRWHLADRNAVFNNMSSIRSRRVSNFWKATHRALDSADSDKRKEAWQAIRRWLSIDAISHTSDQANPITVADQIHPMVTVTRRVTDEFPALLAHADWDLVSDTNLIADEVLEQVIRSRGSPKPMLILSAAASDSPDSPENETPSVPTVAPLLDDLDGWSVETDRSILLTRPVLQDGHWRAILAPLSPSGEQSEPPRRCVVHNVDGLHQGFVVPAGRWRVAFEYRPWWLGPTLIIAFLGWAAGFFLAFRRPTDR